MDFCLCWGLTSQSTIFQSYQDRATASWVINQYFRGVKCLAQGHNTAAVGLEPRPLAWESDTLPLSHRAPLHIWKSLDMCAVWSVSSLSAWRIIGSLASLWVSRKYSDAVVQVCRLIWFLTGQTCCFFLGFFVPPADFIFQIRTIFFASASICLQYRAKSLSLMSEHFNCEKLVLD